MFSPPKFPINADGKRKVGMGWGGGGGAKGDLSRRDGPRFQIRQSNVCGGGCKGGRDTKRGLRRYNCRSGPL